MEHANREIRLKAIFRWSLMIKCVEIYKVFFERFDHEKVICVSPAI